MEAKKYKRLSLKERVIIETLLGENKSKSFISERLQRARSTISREINKWVKHPGETYNAVFVIWKGNLLSDNKSVNY
jgi:IS30 family transposase